MLKCNHHKNRNGRCGVKSCWNFMGNHWPIKHGAKKPQVHKDHDPKQVAPIHQVAKHQPATKPEES